MQKSRTDLLSAAYAAFNRRDIDAVLALMTPDVDWPNGMEGGRVMGRDEVRAYWTRQWSAVNPHVEPESFTDDPLGRAVVHVHQTVRDLTGNLIFDRMINHVYSFKNELIARMDICEPDATPPESTELNSDHQEQSQ